VIDGVMRTGALEAKEVVMLLGLQIAMYHVEDMEQAKAWYSEVLGQGAYFDEPYYAGFSVVNDLHTVFERLQELGATKNTDVQQVGDGILVATVFDPWGNIVGLAENPHFKFPTDA